MGIKNKISMLAILFLFSAMGLSSCLNGDMYDRTEPSFPIALESGSVGQSGVMKTLNIPDLRKPVPIKEETKKLTLEGEIICLPCELKKELRANSQCEKYGHQNVLRTYEGNVYSFIENDKASDLIKNEKYQNKIVRVIGTLFKEANIIDVISFDVIEK